jgi:hypothetical protein
VTYYKFDELSDEAKERARDWFRQSIDDWWDVVYEDAKEIGLKIESFDLNRREIDGGLTKTTAETISLILNNHGDQCDTYKVAKRYQARVLRQAVIDKLDESVDEDQEEDYDLRNEFRRELLKAYLVMLDTEYDWQHSDECIDENIEANDYEFTEDGESA